MKLTIDDYKTHIGGQRGQEFRYQIKKIDNSWVVVVHVLASALTKLPVHLHVARIKEGPIDAIKIALVDTTQCKDLKFLEEAGITLFADRGYHGNNTAKTLAPSSVHVVGPIVANGKLNYAVIHDKDEEPDVDRGQVPWCKQGRDCTIGGVQDLGKGRARQCVLDRKYHRSVAMYGPAGKARLWDVGDYVFRRGADVARVLHESPTLSEVLQGAIREQILVHTKGALELTEGQGTCRAWSYFRRWGLSASSAATLHYPVATRAAHEYIRFKGLKNLEQRDYKRQYVRYFAIVGKDATDPNDAAQTMKVSDRRL